MKIKQVLILVIFLFCVIVTPVSGQEVLSSLAVGPLYNHGILLANRQFSIEISETETNRTQAFLIESDSHGIILLDNVAVGEWVWRIGCAPEYVTNNQEGTQRFGEGEYKDQCINLSTVISQPNVESMFFNSAEVSTRFWGGSIVLVGE